MASSLKETKTELLSDDAEINGFVSFLNGWGQKPFEDQDAHDEEQPKSVAANRLSLAGVVSAEALAEETSFLALHPRVKNAMLTGELISKMTGKRKSSRAIAAQRRLENGMMKKTRAASKKAEWCQAINELGLEEAQRRHCEQTRRSIESKSAAKSKGGAKKTRRRLRTKTKKTGAQRRQAAASFSASLKELRHRIHAQVAKLGKAAEETLAEKGYELMDI